MKAFCKGFLYAARGVWFCIRHERNFRIHLVVAVYVLGFAPSFSLSRAEWAALLLTLALVLVAEALNSAVEYAVDMASPGIHPAARAAKDAASGAVLLCAIASVAVGIVLFGRPAELAALWESLITVPWRLALVAVSLAPALWFVIRGGVSKYDPGVSVKNRKL